MYMSIVWYKRLVLQFVCKIKGNSEPSHQHGFRVARLCVLRGHRISHVQLEFIVLLKELVLLLSWKKQWFLDNLFCHVGLKPISVYCVYNIEAADAMLPLTPCHLQLK